MKDYHHYLFTYKTLKLTFSIFIKYFEIFYFIGMKLFYFKCANRLQIIFKNRHLKKNIMITIARKSTTVLYTSILLRKAKREETNTVENTRVTKNFWMVI